MAVVYGRQFDILLVDSDRDQVAQIQQGTTNANPMSIEPMYIEIVRSALPRFPKEYANSTGGDSERLDPKADERDGDA
ncbi:hypothetical protein HYFRA_00009852 [Hymenoscyphus fraxineus]|uniref:Uncharacterized protein n=1 Tax=Hymenoscyphus fraxineus TaxID=746836 RepID=A0A9N9PYC2_9HELO|nr:hypothetical protein HYFRA_00009852 [Hymenoscyphus fraxineus]